MSQNTPNTNVFNANVLDSDSSTLTLSANVYNTLKNALTTPLFAEQDGGAKKKSRAKKTSKRGSKKAGSKKAGSNKAGSKNGSKKAGSKNGSKRAGSKRAGSKKAGSKKAGSKKAGSKGSKRMSKVAQELELLGGAKPQRQSKSVNSPVLSDSIDHLVMSDAAQEGGKNKKHSKGSKRALPDKLKEFQKLVTHLADKGNLQRGKYLFQLAKMVRDDVPNNKNMTAGDLTKAAMSNFDKNKDKYVKKFNELKNKK